MTADVKISSETQIKKIPAQHIPSQHLLKSAECSLQNRAKIESALADPRAQIPKDFQQAFLDFQYKQQRDFLLRINYIGQLFFLAYFFADYFILHDVYMISAALRLSCVIVSLLACFYFFHYKQDIRLMDMILPIGAACGMFVWITLLLLSSSPWAASYLYASVLFILIANLCIQVQFKPVMYSTLAMCAFAAFGANKLMRLPEACIFLLTFTPVVLFSLYISWNVTRNARRNFLRNLMDDWNLHNFKNLAHTDELTQLYNRRQFVYVAERRIQEWPTPASTCLLMFDVDYFKKINDTYGHDTGDQVLQAIADTTRKEMRQKDVFARFGGEEFIALLTETSINDAMVIAERIRLRIQQETLYIQAGQALNFTVSVGVSELKSHTQNLDELVKQADLALYQAKENGRNCVVRYRASMNAPAKLPQAKTRKPLKGDAQNTEEDSGSWSIM